MQVIRNSAKPSDLFFIENMQDALAIKACLYATTATLNPFTPIMTSDDVLRKVVPACL